MARIPSRVWNAVLNATYTLRSLTRDRLSYDARNYNLSCGYPETLSSADFREFFDRWSIAKRIVNAWPKESWQVKPEIYETEDEVDTPFEVAFEELEKTVHLFHYLTRVDILSGIGRYGGLVLGVDDGQKLDKELQKRNGLKLMYLRALDEDHLGIETLEDDPTSPRFGMPTYYTMKLESISGQDTSDRRVHWTRVIHVADNRETDEIFGVPRMQSAYNHVYDIRKIAGGGAEMFWKGGFPGFGVEINPDIDMDELEVDTDTMKDELKKMFDGLQRYAVLQGAQMKSLAPQVADPTGHFAMVLDAICIGMEMPKRIFLGSEQAKLASTQDQSTWERRLRFRQENYLSPMLVRPTIMRLQEIGVLPESQDLIVKWPNLSEPSEADQVKVAKDRTEAIAKYVQSGAAELVPPRKYFSLVHKWTDEEIDSIEDELETFRAEADLDNDLEDEEVEVDVIEE